MKPLHIGLLVVGATIAGGLAVTMTQAPPIPVVAAPVPPPSSPAVSRVAASAPVAKPSPIPPPPERVAPERVAPERVAPERVAPPARAAAPQPVYDEPAKSAIRKFKPISTASLYGTKPTQWTPKPYEAPAGAARTPAAPAAPPPAAAEPDAAPAATPVNAPRHVTLQSGMAIPVRLDDSLTSDQTTTGKMFQGSLAEPFVVDGLVIAERGARVTGRIVNSENARVELGLATLSTSDGQQVAISTDPWTKLIGSGDALGSGTIIRFRLASRVTITEQQVAGR